MAFFFYNYLFFSFSFSWGCSCSPSSSSSSLPFSSSKRVSPCLAVCSGCCSALLCSALLCTDCSGCCISDKPPSDIVVRVISNATFPHSSFVFAVGGAGLICGRCFVGAALDGCVYVCGCGLDVDVDARNIPLRFLTASTRWIYFMPYRHGGYNTLSRPPLRALSSMELRARGTGTIA
ncbi:hypothetical protein P154DRAFT_350427 [Amniculicola lignicola CBS 123094]|uniref:Secreted protein n=1 Tax=Amniculicola lignicola CBS 123094 TaxID=1392246 RepID=A0A6A5W077_9PLEO|nr:hypothetical protein P154DRAFT_350427 [Amniculicola lignicola CBS 123094]